MKEKDALTLSAQALDDIITGVIWAERAQELLKIERAYTALRSIEESYVALQMQICKPDSREDDTFLEEDQEPEPSKVDGCKKVGKFS